MPTFAPDVDHNSVVSMKTTLIFCPLSNVIVECVGDNYIDRQMCSVVDFSVHSSCCEISVGFTLCPLKSAVYAHYAASGVSINDSNILIVIM